MIKQEESAIPKTPTAPPTLGRARKTDYFKCPRMVVYRGQTLNCDSNLAWDAENLRPIFKDTPDAIEELNDYQRTRDLVHDFRYVGGGGLLLAAAGLIFGKLVDGGTAVVIRNVSVIGGLTVAAGSFVTSLALIRTNERKLGRAVQHYNDAHPEDPVELQFSTGFQF